MSERHAERGQRGAPLELFFDPVFASAFTQVTTFLRMTRRGVGSDAAV